MKLFVETLNVSNRDDILDIGGTPLNWGYVSIQPWITIGNIRNIPASEKEEGRFSYGCIDGTNLPFGDASFDIVFSNSVIEHVGDWNNQEKFAGEVRRVAKRYFVQTPNKWFFIEPHFIAPLIHYLPLPIFRRLLPFFSVRYWFHWLCRSTEHEKIDDMLEEIRLLTESEMRELFPDAQIIREKFLFFTKSLIAVKV